MKQTLLAILVALSAPAVADSVIKSVDEAGNVTYSSSVPPGSVAAEPVQLDPPPPSASAMASEERAAQAVDLADQLNGEQAQEKARKGAVAKSTEDTIQAAEQNLENAKVIQDSDWQNLQAGGRTLKEGYYERVQAAEKERAAAQEAR